MAAFNYLILLHKPIRNTTNHRLAISYTLIDSIITSIFCLIFNHHQDTVSNKKCVSIK